MGVLAAVLGVVGERAVPQLVQGRSAGRLLEQVLGPPVGQPGPAAHLVDVARRQLHPGPAVGQEHRTALAALQQPRQQPGGSGLPKRAKRKARKQRAAPERRARDKARRAAAGKKPRSPRPRGDSHEPGTCGDRDCPKFGCKAYWQGMADSPSGSVSATHIV